MCLGVPMKILSCDDLIAVCHNEEEGRSENVDLSLVGSLKPGTWIQVFMGAAREIIEPEQLDQVLLARKAMFAAINGGNIDDCFPDLVNREPQLPDFLKNK